MLRAILLPIHITAGVAAISSGFVALYSGKGSKLHTKSGIIFVYSMLTMAVCGSLLASFVKPNPGNVLAGMFTFYFVTTALLTVRPRFALSRHVDVACLLLVIAVGSAHATFAVQALRSTTGTRFGFPPQPFLMFASVAFLAILGDLRTLIRGPLQGSKRIARHLWRMCFGMFIATASFFLGQAKIFPKPIRIIPLLAVPVLLVLITMFYWMWRVRLRHNLRGLTTKKEAPAPALSIG